MEGAATGFRFFRPALAATGIPKVTGMGIRLRCIYGARSACFSKTSPHSADQHPPNSQGNACYLPDPEEGGGRGKEERRGSQAREVGASAARQGEVRSHARAPRWSRAEGFPDDGTRELKQRGPPPARSRCGKLRWRLSKKRGHYPISWRCELRFPNPAETAMGACC